MESSSGGLGSGQMQTMRATVKGQLKILFASASGKCQGSEFRGCAPGILGKVQKGGVQSSHSGIPMLLNVFIRDLSLKMLGYKYHAYQFAKGTNQRETFNMLANDSENLDNVIN